MTNQLAWPAKPRIETRDRGGREDSLTANLGTAIDFVRFRAHLLSWHGSAYTISNARCGVW